MWGRRKAETVTPALSRIGPGIVVNRQMHFMYCSSMSLLTDQSQLLCINAGDHEKRSP